MANYPLTQIQVMSTYGGEGRTGNDGRRRGGPVKGEPQQTAVLNNFALEQLRAIPGVDGCSSSEITSRQSGMFKYQKLEAGVNIIGIDTRLPCQVSARK